MAILSRLFRRAKESRSATVEQQHATSDKGRQNPAKKLRGLFKANSRKQSPEPATDKTTDAASINAVAAEPPVLPSLPALDLGLNFNAGEGSLSQETRASPPITTADSAGGLDEEYQVKSVAGKLLGPGAFNARLATFIDRRVAQELGKQEGKVEESERRAEELAAKLQVLQGQLQQTTGKGGQSDRETATALAVRGDKDGESKRKLAPAAHTYSPSYSSSSSGSDDGDEVDGEVVSPDAKGHLDPVFLLQRARALEQVVESFGPDLEASVGLFEWLMSRELEKMAFKWHTEVDQAGRHWYDQMVAREQEWEEVMAERDQDWQQCLAAVAGERDLAAAKLLQAEHEHYQLCSQLRELSARLHITQSNLQTALTTGPAGGMMGAGEGSSSAAAWPAPAASQEGMFAFSAGGGPSGSDGAARPGSAGRGGGVGGGARGGPRRSRFADTFANMR